MDGAGSGLTVEQGPRWLVELLFFAPPWVGTVLTLVVVVVVGVTAWRVHRYGVTPAQFEAAGTNGLVMLGIIVATPWVRDTFVLPYLADVTVGAALGIGVVRGGLVVLKRLSRTEFFDAVVRS
jgi:hypothetical protein